jgi:hypothetical protein
MADVYQVPQKVGVQYERRHLNAITGLDATISERVPMSQFDHETVDVFVQLARAMHLSAGKDAPEMLKASVADRIEEENLVVVGRSYRLADQSAPGTPKVPGIIQLDVSFGFRNEEGLEAYRSRLSVHRQVGEFVVPVRTDMHINGKRDLRLKVALCDYFFPNS